MLARTNKLFRTVISNVNNLPNNNFLNTTRKRGIITLGLFGTGGYAYSTFKSNKYNSIEAEDSDTKKEEHGFILSNFYI